MKPYLQKTKRTFYGNERFGQVKYFKGKQKRNLLKHHKPNEQVCVLTYTLHSRSSIKRSIRKDIINELNQNTMNIIKLLNPVLVTDLHKLLVVVYSDFTEWKISEFWEVDEGEEVNGLLHQYKNRLLDSTLGELFNCYAIKMNDEEIVILIVKRDD